MEGALTPAGRRKLAALLFDASLGGVQSDAHFTAKTFAVKNYGH